MVAEDRFEDGRLELSRTLPVLDLDLTHGQTGACPDEEIWTCLRYAARLTTTAGRRLTAD